ncbi:hypothetical protein DVA86_21710 [Streptomyces armeniacus]|uniref:Uncharacterized protein n=1 Tax=Streptomyces armeniacus TaxID=83291 RepID=A0A345XTA7_9ACTN|nr:hypothetical protein DVA86_21710 [Streptomyces armeniacus]
MAEIAEEFISDRGDLDRTAAQLIDVILRVEPSYQQIPVESLRSGNRRILLTALEQLSTGRQPQPHDLRTLEKLCQVRARQGIKLASILTAYQVAGHEFWTVFAQRLAKGGVGAEDLLTTSEWLWRWLDTVALAVAKAYREVDVHAAREDERRVGEALRALLSDPLTDPRAEMPAEYVAELGLDPGRPYAVFRGRPLDGVPVGVLREAVAGGMIPDGVAAMIDHELVGVADPDSLSASLPVELAVFGAGPAVPAGHLRQSDVSASRALAAALRLGRTGINRMADLRLAAVAAGDTEVTQLLTRRILHPLRAKRRYGQEIWQSVVTLLEHGLRIEEAALKLHVHPNTLRHRLASFTDLTGLDVRNPADCAEIWWLAVLGATAQDPAAP